MKNHPLHHFETFLSVAESGGFTAAAKKLHLSKAAVSRTIRKLEESLNAPLLIRTTRSIRLTEEGEHLLHHCRKIKIEIDAAREFISGINDQPSGHLKISCNRYFSEALLAKIIKQYMEKCPDVTVDILFDERMADMHNEQVDIVFGINWPAPPDVVARPIGKTRYVICASAEYLRQYGTPKSIKDLEGHTYIPHSGRGAHRTIVDLKRHQHVPLDAKLMLNSAHFMKTCALNHMGIIQLHDYMIENELKSGQLIEILQEHIKPAIPIYVYYQKHRLIQPKIKQFIELIFDLI